MSAMKLVVKVSCVLAICNSIIIVMARCHTFHCRLAVNTVSRSGHLPASYRSFAHLHIMCDTDHLANTFLYHIV